MNYMVVWNISRENFKPAVARFKKNAPLPKGLALLGRWHALGSGEGFSLMRTDDPVALSEYVASWADLVDISVVPVVDDAQMLKAL